VAFYKLKPIGLTIYPLRLTAPNVVTACNRFATDKLSVDLLNENLLDIDKLVSEHDEPLAFNDETKQQILDIPWVVSALWAAFMAVQNGVTNEQYRRRC
jgi:hypothetical protein